MKSIFTVFTLFLITISCIDAAPENRQFSLETKLIGKASYDGELITQTRQVEIEVSRSGTDTSKEVTATWNIYGHERKNHKLVLIKSGTLTYSLEGGKRDTQTSPELIIKGKRKHSKTESTGKGKKKKTKTISVPASGQEYYGYSVEVKLGKEIVASYSSKSSFK